MSNIDQVVNWLEDKDASYLCKEDSVVYFASITGNDEDKDWQNLTLGQLLRTLKFMVNESITQEDIIAGLQESGRLFEMGVKSTYKTPEGIFNYAEHSATGISEKLVAGLAKSISRQKFSGITISNLNRIHDKLEMLSNTKLTNIARNRFYRKYFSLYGYVLREGANRVFYQGRKTTVMLHKNSQAKDIEATDNAFLMNIAGLVFAEVNK